MNETGPGTSSNESRVFESFDRFMYKHGRIAILSFSVVLGIAVGYIALFSASLTELNAACRKFSEELPFLCSINELNWLRWPSMALISTFFFWELLSYWRRYCGHMSGLPLIVYLAVQFLLIVLVVN